MPRKLRARPGNKPVRKKSNSEPLAEGLRKRRPWGFFKKISDVGLIEYAKKLVKEKEIKSRSRLEKKDGRLYDALRGRKLLDRLEFEEGQRNWASISDDELVENARKFIEDKRIESRSGLEKEDLGLYDVLRRRKLLDRLEFEEVQRNWVSMSDEELVEYTKRFIEEKSVKNRQGLQKEDWGLYDVLRRRKLLDRLEFEEVQRNWVSMSDEELVEYTKKFMKEKGIKNRSGLQKEDGGLYGALQRRKLLDRLRFEKRGRPKGFFKNMSDDELVKYSKRSVEKAGIQSRNGLKKKDGGLYTALLRRKLLDKIGLNKRTRNWASMSDNELIDFARRFIEERGVKSRSELNRMDGGLYNTIQKRKLLDKLSLDTKIRDWMSMNDVELVTHTRKFIEEKKIKNISELQKEDSGLYGTLRKRKLLYKVGLEKIKRRPCGFFIKMSDDELVEYARESVKEKRINGRYELEKEDSSLYQVLRQRKLLDLVFEDVEKAKEKQAVQDVFDALQEFGGPG